MEQMKKKKQVKPKCTKCGSGQVYTLVDGTLVCRFCGHREPKGK